MSRIAFISFDYMSICRIELCTLLIKHWYAHGVQGIDATSEGWNGEGMRLITKEIALHQLILQSQTHTLNDPIRSCDFWSENARFALSSYVNGSITQIWISILLPAWYRPYPCCDEYIDWEKYSKLVLDTPITAPLVGISTCDDEYFS